MSLLEEEHSRGKWLDINTIGHEGKVRIFPWWKKWTEAYFSIFFFVYFMHNIFFVDLCGQSPNLSTMKFSNIES